MNRHDTEIHLYKMFNDELIKNTGIDWFEVETIYEKIGNAPGIYPDTLLLISTIISELPQPKGIEASFDHLRRDLLAQHMPEQKRNVVGSALRKSLSQGQPVNPENNVDTYIDFAMKRGTIDPSAKSERVFSTPLPHVHNYPGDLNKIVELGSGVSTLFISKICKDLNIEFISYEEKDEWKNKTCKLLNQYNLKPMVIDLDINNLSLTDTDIIFIDCSNLLRVMLLKSDKLNKIPIIMVDDAERTNISNACSKFMCNSNRHDYYVYNGVGRIDRHLYINSINMDIDNIVKQMVIGGN